MENMGLGYHYSMITIVRKKRFNPRMAGEGGGGIYFWILRYTLTVNIVVALDKGL